MGAGLGLKIFLGAVSGLGATLVLVAFVGGRATQEAVQGRILRGLGEATDLYRAHVESEGAARQDRLSSAARESDVPSLLAKSGGAPDTYHHRAMELAERLAADSVFVFDAQGILLTRADRGRRGRTLPDTSLASWASSPRRDLTAAPAAFLDAGGAASAHLVASIPVMDASGQRVVGALAATFPFDDTRIREVGALTSADALRALHRSLLVVGGLLVLLLVPASWLLAASLTRPFRRLARVAEDVGRGQFDVEVPQLRGEAGLLTRALASMVTELRATAALEAVVAGQRPHRAGAPSPGPQDSRHEDGSLVRGTLAGRYEIRSVLGEGGMGTVYRVRDRELDDEVALKVLKPVSGETVPGTPGSTGPTGELLRQEIKLARMVTHANVVRVHDFGEADGVRYFTMEYVPGTTLRELLAREALLDLSPTLQIAKQICRGLAAVHRAGIVHGDLKPQNVIVMGNGVAKLMDFGVARTRSALARGEPLAGTPAYMSPEQARGAGLDERSDLYSAGVLLFELFTGRCPFVGDDPYETLRMHLHEPPPDPRRLRSDIPEPLAQIIVMCLAKSPFRRPPSAADLERLLMRVRP